jgi:TolB-like protein
MAKQTVGSPAADGAAPTAAEVRAALERILRSACFEHAGRASDFLRFVVGQTLAGEGERLKGYTIATQVFGRPPDFDAQSDPLVRVEALRLRQRLTEYYAGPGAADLVRLELPRGGYAVKAAYAVSEPEPVAREASAPAPTRRNLSSSLTRAASVTAALLLIVATVVVTVQWRAPAAEQPRQEQAPERAHRTKIAVVPLENLSGTPDFDRLAAGLTEEIMLRLDALDLFVIATQAKWYGPGAPLDDVLGAEHSYVLTGSVRNHAGGARITLRIIEGGTGTQLWSAGYDEPPSIERRPELQLKIAREVAAAAAPFGPVFDAELALARGAAHTLELPDCQTRYRAFRRSTDPALFPEAAACWQSLVERQPQLAHAWAGLAMVEIDEHLFYSGNDAASPLARGWEATRKALALDASNGTANVALARAQYYSGDPDFVATAEKVLALDPTNVDYLAVIGILLTAYGDDIHGLELVTRAQSLSPRPRPTFNVAYAFAHLRAGEPCDALAAAQRMEAPNWFITYVLASAAAALCGDEQATVAARKRLLALSPNFEAEAIALIGYWRFDPALNDALLDGLRKAGFDLHEHR